MYPFIIFFLDFHWSLSVGRVNYKTWNANSFSLYSLERIDAHEFGQQLAQQVFADGLVSHAGTGQAQLDGQQVLAKGATFI